MFTVPTIDISPYLDPESSAAARDGVARALDDACGGVGFVQVVGHGIAPGVIDGLTAALDEFYALPLEVKKQYARPGQNRGYSPPKSESLSMSLGVAAANQMNDFYEAFTVGSEGSWFPGLDLPESSYPTNTWPDAAPGFRPAVESWFDAARGLSRVLLTAFTDALGLPPGYFDGMTDHSIDALKLNNYTLPEGEIELAGELTGMGAHTDFGILTVLVGRPGARAPGARSRGAVARRGTRRRRAAGQPRRRHGAVDERPVAIDCPPRRPARRRRPDPASSIGSVLLRRQRRCRHRDAARVCAYRPPGISADHRRREHRCETRRDEERNRTRRRRARGAARDGRGMRPGHRPSTLGRS